MHACEYTFIGPTGGLYKKIGVPLYVGSSGKVHKLGALLSTGWMLPYNHKQQFWSPVYAEAAVEGRSPSVLCITCTDSCRNCSNYFGW